MSANTVTAGYPVHRVVSYRQWTNQHQACFTDYTAACGHSATLSGHLGVFGQAGNARRLELCTLCFPGKTMHGYFPEPTKITYAGP